MKVQIETSWGDPKVYTVDPWDIEHNPYLLHWAKTYENPDYVLELCQNNEERASYLRMKEFGGMPRLAIHTALFQARDILIPQMGFAIPDRKALELVKDHSPNGVLEIGAGTGYWASLLSKLGVNVLAYDTYTGQYRDGLRHGSHFPIVKASHRKALSIDVNHHRTLLLSWPDYSRLASAKTGRNMKRVQELKADGMELMEAFSKAHEEEAEREKSKQTTPPMEWPAQTLSLYRGNVVAYVGEGDGGCTADDAFHEILDQLWEEIEDHEIPQWWGIHDRLRIYKRKG